jgi:RHS repeat-associated protein
MKPKLIISLLTLSAALGFWRPQNTLATGSCTVARFNFWKSKGCPNSPGSAGAPASGANGAGSNQASCPTCGDDQGMSRWWVDEPNISLHVSDMPLSYRTSSGQRMDFRFLYKQNYMLPLSDQCPGYYHLGGGGTVRNTADAYAKFVRTYGMTNAAWANNWTMDILFWDANWESIGTCSTSGCTPPAHPAVFQTGYEALVFRPDGGIYDLGNVGSTSLADPLTQVGLHSLSGLAYPTVGTQLHDTNNIYWGEPATNGFTLVYPDGSQDVFSFCYYLMGTPRANFPPQPETTARAQLTKRIDPQGRVTRLGYEQISFTNATVYTAYRVRYVVDIDGRTNTFLYNTNFAQHAWQISEIDDPYGRKALFDYAPFSGFTNGFLNSITDATGNKSSFAYAGTNGWISSLTTPYGTTGFKYYQYSDDPSVPSSFSFRATYVTEPEGACQLFYYRHENHGLIPTEEDSPSVDGHPFDDGHTADAHHYTLDYRNSYHWDRRQFAALSASVVSNLQSPFLTLSNSLNGLTADDYNKASLKHWLLGGDLISVTESLSSERAPSPDLLGQVVGARTWYDYANKPAAEIEGDAQINCVAQLLPNGTNQYVRYTYYNGAAPLAGLVAYNASSYSMTNGAIGELTNWFNYAANGIDLISSSNSMGQSMSYVYNTRHQVTSITNALHEATLMAWDELTNLTYVQFPGGQSVSLNYNFPVLLGHPLTNTSALLTNIVVQPDGLEIDLVDYTNGLPRVIHRFGPGVADLWITNSWDGLNRLTGTSFPDHSSISNIFTFLDLTGRKDRLDQWSHYTYDGLQHLQTATDPLTNTTTFSWCGCGELLSVIDALTNVTTFNYDNQSRLTNVTRPDTSSLTYQYDLSGRLTNLFDGSGRSVQLFYNNQGLVTTASNVYGPVFQAVYDALDRPTIVTDADNLTLTNTYDKLNRLILRTWPDQISEGLVYATNGLIFHTNRDQKLTRFTRDNAGRVLGVTNANQEITAFNYDAAGRLTSLVDGLTHSTTWRYNEYGWVTNKQDALGHDQFRFVYDANGQLINRWTPANTNTTYTYDVAGNLKTIAYPGAASPTSPVAFAYDPLNRLTNMTDAVGVSGFGYTTAGRLQTEVGPWTSSTVSLGYTQGHRTSLGLTQPSGSWAQTYAYDDTWRLAGLTSAAGLFNYAYGAQAAASALVSGINLPNGASITNHYDALARQDYTGLLNHWGQVLDGYTYQHDPLGLSTNLTRDIGLTNSSVKLGYDNIGQLISWNAKEGSGTARLNEQLGYAYDAAGNLHYRTNGSLLQTFTSDNLNQLSTVGRGGPLTVEGATPAPAASVTVNGQTAETYGDFTFARTNNTLANGSNSFTLIAQNAYGLKVTNTLAVNLPASASYQYDLNGNLTGDGLRSFFYDAENQLTNVSVAGAWKSEFVYDGFGRRRITKDYTWQSGAWVRTNETRYVYDRMLVLQERDSNNVAQVTYTRGLDLSGSRQGAGGIGGLLARTDANGSSFFHGDGAGNVTALMDANQTITARYLYDPFGRLTGKWGRLADVNRYRFSSKETHPNSGLVYYGYRFYEPNLQRWINRDPIEEAGGINLFRFVGNSPVNYVDPKGLDGSSEADANLVLSIMDVINALVNPPPPSPPPGLMDPIYQPDEPSSLDIFMMGLGMLAPELMEIEQELQPIKNSVRTLTEEEKKLYGRCQLRYGARKEIWERSKAPDGNVYNPDGRILKYDEPWEIGHKPEHTFETDPIRTRAAEEGWSRKDWITYQQDPDIYRPELPSTNRSHRFQDVTLW